ncbi:MAG: hypothetical protein A2170_10465 [Deltaproteobacteria bacterium RBG_13_53_10]|nr:MAG: hypothetical protein A2170_10465 [Deltaproteobacteria bacterium RBG_13_53_10]
MELRADRKQTSAGLPLHLFFDHPFLDFSESSTRENEDREAVEEKMVRNFFYPVRNWSPHGLKPVALCAGG